MFEEAAGKKKSAPSIVKCCCKLFIRRGSGLSLQRPGMGTERRGKLGTGGERIGKKSQSGVWEGGGAAISILFCFMLFWFLLVYVILLFYVILFGVILWVFKNSN